MIIRSRCSPSGLIPHKKALIDIPCFSQTHGQARQKKMGGCQVSLPLSTSMHAHVFVSEICIVSLSGLISTSIPMLHSSRARAVHDSDAMNAFVREKVGVLPDRILNLRNEKANRKGIEDAFSSLWGKSSPIARNDPILIYYAGHGVQMPRPKTWGTGGAERQVEMIQGLLPYDADPQDSVTRTIFPIPDRTIGTWLNMLAVPWKGEQYCM